MLGVTASVSGTVTPEGTPMSMYAVRDGRADLALLYHFHTAAARHLA
jgi:hypothetical protein